jgi:cardiolipin synthase A/B
MDTALFLVQYVAILFLGLMLFLALFEPGLPYKVPHAPCEDLASDEFLRVLGALAGAQIHHGNRVEVLSNGEVFYEAELAAIREAQHSVNIEAYIFRKGEVMRRFLEALTERARAGVRVNLVLDAVGCFLTGHRHFDELRAAGGRVNFYHPIRWYTLPRINNRTHRELLIVDGRIGFLGGAGFADHWLLAKGRRKIRWRDTMFRVQGPAVRDLQSTFAENWLETSGELLVKASYFPPNEPHGPSTALVVRSTPSAGRSTRNRMLYQTLLASAQKTLHITTPYFLPDRSARAELARAVRERNVDVKVIVPGKHIDHLLTRRSSRRLFGELLRSGVKIYEYEPTMIHTKSLIVDGMWSVVGSTNLDNRSFGINDEVNLAAFDPEVAAHLEQDFAADLLASRAVSYRRWRARPIMERAHELLGRLLERQQ